MAIAPVIFIGIKSPKFGVDVWPQLPSTRHRLWREQYIWKLQQICEAPVIGLYTAFIIQFGPLN